MSRLLTLIPLLAPIFLALGMAKFWIYLKRREARRFPFKDAVMREPGYSQLKAREKIMDELDLHLLVLPLYPLMMYTTYLQMRLSNGEVSLFTISLLVATSLALIAHSLYKIWCLQAKMHCLKLGYAGEVAVGQALNQLMLQGYQVFHDVPFNHFNADHVVVGRAGVFVVETKLRTKRSTTNRKEHSYKVRFDGKALYFPDRPKVPCVSALEQASNEAKSVGNWLTQATGEPVTTQPVLALPGWWINGTNKQGLVWVFNHKQLVYLPPADPHRQVLSEARIQAIAYQLQTRCARDDLQPQVLKTDTDSAFQEV